MVQGPSIDEQRAFFEHERSNRLPKDEPSDNQGGNAEAPEAEGLYEVQQKVCIDKFNDGSETDSEEEWYSITRG